MAPRAESPSALAQPPRLPSRYRPVRPIAAGATAIVWCAEDRLLWRRVAVKLLAQPYASDPEAVRRFQSEARAAARLSGHPHVVTIFDVGEDPAFAPFLVMEDLPGGTAADAVRLDAVTRDDAVRWLHEAASAIDFAHGCGILHRDIKPANLLLDCEGSLHVADFGIAQVGRDDTALQARQVVGTAYYLPPERALGRPATKASDLYSLAVVAFELLTGERPYRATAYRTQARQHVEQPPPRASACSPDLPRRIDAVLARGMAKMPQQRWPSAQAFAVALERALAPRARAGRGVRRASAGTALEAPNPAAAAAGSPAAAGLGDADRRGEDAVVVAAPVDEPEPRRRRPPVGLLAGAVASLAMMAAGIAWATLGSGRAHNAATLTPVARPRAQQRGGLAAGVVATKASPPATAQGLAARGNALAQPAAVTDQLALSGQGLGGGGSGGRGSGGGASGGGSARGRSGGANTGLKGGGASPAGANATPVAASPPVANSTSGGGAGGAPQPTPGNPSAPPPPGGGGPGPGGGQGSGPGGYGGGPPSSGPPGLDGGGPGGYGGGPPWSGPPGLDGGGPSPGPHGRR